MKKYFEDSNYCNPKPIVLSNFKNNRSYFNTYDHPTSSDSSIVDPPDPQIDPKSKKFKCKFLKKIGKRHCVIQTPKRDKLTPVDIKPIKFGKMECQGVDVVPHTVEDKIWENDRECIFFKANGSEYILQPKAMLYRGSMCVAELLSNKQ